MTKSIHIGEQPNGYDFNYVLYETAIPTNNYAVCYPGAGEGGLIDGSQISKAWANGWPKMAELGWMFPWNILSIQSLMEPGFAVPSYAECQPGTMPLLDDLGFEKVLITGYSHGGAKSVDFLWEKNPSLQTLWTPAQRDKIVGILCMCGLKGNGNAYVDALDVPYMGVHGTADESQNKYSSGLAVVTGLNAFYPPRVNLASMVSIPGGNHASAWIQGYDPNNQYGAQAYAFAMNAFNEAADVITLEVPWGMPIAA